MTSDAAAASPAPSSWARLVAGRPSQLLGTWGARTADELLAALGGPGAAAVHTLELRLDLPRDGAARLRELIAAAPCGVVATCRRASEGGGFTAGERDRIDVLLRAADAGAAWLDVEDDVTDRDVERLLASGAKLLRSRHVQRLPDDAESLADRLVALPGHAAKLVALHGGAADALRMLTIVRDACGRLCGHVADVPFTRTASAALGAPFVYAAMQPGGTIGLPMPTAFTLRRRDDFARIVGGTRLFVLLGVNVEGSVSPQMLNAALTAAGADVVALRWSCDDPAPALETIRRFGWAGAAVTIPHKEAVFRRGDVTMPPSVRAIGAVNTVIHDRGCFDGHNTDESGLLQALAGDALVPRTRQSRVLGRTFLVIGAGGAARAAVAVAQGLHARPLVLARRPDAARGLGAAVAATAEEAAESRPAIVVNATPTGPPGGTTFFDPALLPEKAVVLDMLVHARPTALLAAAARAGHETVSGLEMLVAQAAAQVELIGPAAPDRDAMRAVGAAWLRRRDAPIVLVGLRCAGKTTVGERAAALLGRTFHDTDREVERRAGRTVEDLLRAGEERAFRTIEADVLHDAIEIPGTVIACGGGAALHGPVFDELAAWGLVVLLDAPDDVLLARRAASPRAPLTPLPLAEELARQRAERMPVYRAAARLTLDVSAVDAESVATAIAAWWDALPPEVWSAARVARP